MNQENSWLEDKIAELETETQIRRLDMSARRDVIAFILDHTHRDLIDGSYVLVVDRVTPQTAAMYAPSFAYIWGHNLDPSELSLDSLHKPECDVVKDSLVNEEEFTDLTRELADLAMLAEGAEPLTIS